MQNECEAERCCGGRERAEREREGGRERERERERDRERDREGPGTMIIGYFGTNPIAAFPLPMRFIFVFRRTSCATVRDPRGK